MLFPIFKCLPQVSHLSSPPQSVSQVLAIKETATDTEILALREYICTLGRVVIYTGRPKAQNFLSMN